MEEAFLTDFIIQIKNSAVAMALVSTLLVPCLLHFIKKLIDEKLKNKYDELRLFKKEEIDTKLEGLKGDIALLNTRTNLFFDHQREAFSEILKLIFKIQDDWINTYDEDLYYSISEDDFKSLKKLITMHQLFIDVDCSFVLNLINTEYTISLRNSPDSRIKSLEFDYQDRRISEDELIAKSDPNYPEFYEFMQEYSHYKHYQKVEFLYQRLANLFRNKIGSENDLNLFNEIAFLVAVESVNENFKIIGERYEGKIEKLNILNEICSAARNATFKEKMIVAKKETLMLIEFVKICREEVLNPEKFFYSHCDLLKLDRVLDILESIKAKIEIVN